jgi:hypothetical protein
MDTRRLTYIVWCLAAAALSLTIVALQPSTARPSVAIISRPLPTIPVPIAVDIGTAWLGPVASAPHRGTVLMRGARMTGSAGDESARPLAVARHQSAAANRAN